MMEARVASIYNPRSISQNPTFLSKRLSKPVNFGLTVVPFLSLALASGCMRLSEMHVTALVLYGR